MTPADPPNNRDLLRPREGDPPNNRQLFGSRDPQGMRIGAPRWQRSIMLPLVVVIALVLVSLVHRGRTGAAPNVEQAARFALAPATTGVAGASGVLAARPTGVSGIRFPARAQPGGWRAVGLRRASVQGRAMTVVRYRAPSGTSAGEVVVAGAPLSAPAGTVAVHDGTRFTIGRFSSVLVVTWTSDGHTCVLAGEHVAASALLRLAGALDAARG